MDVSDITVTHLNDLIRVGEEKVNKILRVRAMETALSVTIGAQGTAAVSVGAKVA
jgi:hypothetical protein